MTLSLVPPPPEQEHVTDGSPCWCSPETLCAECEPPTPEPCIHGTDRPEVVVHRQDS